MLKESTLKWLGGRDKTWNKNNTANCYSSGLTRHGDLPTQNYPTRFPAQKQMTNQSRQNQKYK